MNKATQHTLIALLLCLTSMCVAVNALAAQSNVVVTDNVNTQLIADHQSVRPGQSFFIILRIDIREGWHTYWRNPGDSGQATAIKWQLPEGVSASNIEWPYPERQYMGPVANYGYHGVALHRVQFTLDRNWPVGKPVPIIGNATWLVCQEECIPEKGRFEITVSTSKKAEIAAQNIADFQTIKTQLPSELGVQSNYQYSNDGQIRFEFSPSKEIVNAASIEYFPYDWGVLQAPAKQILVTDRESVSVTSKKGDLSFSTPLQGVLVVRGSDANTRAFQVESTFKTPVAPNVLPDETSPIGLISALVLAFIGGVLLNLMPCVFPVLSIKAMSLVNHVSEPRSVVRRHGVAYTAGILASFIMLGVILLVLQATGQQIGWGFQLQSPVFVSVVVIVLFVLGLSLSGFVDVGASLMGVGSGLAQQAGYKGTFFTGVLAVIVATPCTAPFMGPAVGFALTQTPLITLLVLLALGFGLALPYLVLCFFPLLSKWLPKPGLWMQKLQQFLAFPMYATAAWLVWVLGIQTNINKVFILLIICILVALGIWLWQSTAKSIRFWRLIGLGGVFLMAIIVVVLLAKISKPLLQTEIRESVSATQNYQTFSQQRLSELQSQGVPVFVNMTAAWCITCLANEKVALSTEQLKQYFRDNKIVYLKGDWTNQDPAITQYLKSFGRSSVPLYVYYPAGKTQEKSPKVLPQILTTTSVIDSIESAQTSP